MKLAYGLPLIDTLALADLDNYLQILSSIGYEGAEPSVCYAAGVRRDEIAGLLERSGMKISGLRSGGVYDVGGVRFSSPDPAARKKAVQMIKDIADLCAFFDCSLLLGRVQGWLEKGEDLDTAKKYITECMRECSDYAGESGVYISYEPINRFEMNYNHTTKEMVKFINNINSEIRNDVRLLMDVYHMMLEDNSIPAAFVRSRDLIGHVHFSDSNRGVPGTGTIDFAEAVKVLEAMEYRGWIALEVGMEFCDYREGAAASYNYLKPMIDAALASR